MTNKTTWVLGILVTAAVAAAPIADAATARTTLRLGSMRVAKIDGDRVVPLRSERALARVLEEGLNASDDPRVYGTIAHATIESSGGRYFLVGRGRLAGGGCLRPSVELTPGPDAIVEPAAAGWRFIRVEGCASEDCGDCLTTRDGEGHVIDCACIPAGHCQKVVVYIPIPIYP